MLLLFPWAFMACSRENFTFTFKFISQMKSVHKKPL